MIDGENDGHEESWNDYCEVKKDIVKQLKVLLVPNDYAQDVYYWILLNEEIRYKIKNGKVIIEDLKEIYYHEMQHIF